MISSSSEEIIRTPSPSSASSLISGWISALAPTSMPRVGSSRINSFEPVAEPAREQNLLLIAAGELADRLIGARRT